MGLSVEILRPVRPFPQLFFIEAPQCLTDDGLLQYLLPQKIPGIGQRFFQLAADISLTLRCRQQQRRF